jgi:hypothetical protein
VIEEDLVVKFCVDSKRAPLNGRLSMEICSKDPHLDKLYSEISVKKDESIVRFFKRSFEECCKKLIEPSRLKYDTTDLNESILNYESFEVKEFTIVSKGLNLHCALWKNNTVEENETTFESSTILEEDNKPCLIYLHTNTRSLIDAIEVLPLADKAGCHVLSFDFPGMNRIIKIIVSNHTP